MERSQPRSGRRGVILVAVLVVVSLAALGGASAMWVASAEVEGASGSLRRLQGRAVAWSGVQATMAELASQRQGILNGEMPRLTEEWEVYTESSGRRAVVRLVADGAGAKIHSEQARLDVNTAGRAMLQAIGLEEELAQAIVSRRQRQPFFSTLELLEVEGITPELLFGDGWEAPDEPVQGQGEAGLPLISRLTVFSFDPNVQAGVGPGGSSHRGQLRINLNTPWSERLGRAIEERFGRSAGETARGIMGTGVKIDSLAVLVQGAALNNLDRRAWPILVDAFTVSDLPYIPGRIDLNMASPEVLACIPGISEEAAAQIVQRRGGLTAEARSSILWPLQEDILTVQEMARAADHLTTRSMQWRVVIEGGFVAADDRRSWDELVGAVLQDRVVLEAVIDIASERPRVAYLRDITLLPVARALAWDLEPPDETSLWAGDREQWDPGRLWQEVPGDLLSAPAPGSRPDNAAPDARISELPLQGPIQADASDSGSAAGDPRIGRWTPGPARKDEGR
jgi:DNA uptake protein ComE-like DNA-binding protein